MIAVGVELLEERIKNEQTVIYALRDEHAKKHNFKPVTTVTPTTAAKAPNLKQKPAAAVAKSPALKKKPAAVVAAAASPPAATKKKTAAAETTPTPAAGTQRGGKKQRTSSGAAEALPQFLLGCGGSSDDD